MKKFALVIIIFTLSGCTSANIYNSELKQKIDEEFAKIFISFPESKYLSELHMGLEKFIPYNDSNEKKYILNLQIKHNNFPLLISSNSDILRENTTIDVHYELTKIDQPHQPALLKGKVTLRSSHDSISTPYTTHLESENTLKTLSFQASEIIHRKLLIYFHKYLSKS